jgi:DTW domain-containing protein YfiP
MLITLLTHQREVIKTTNTGALVVDALGDDASVVIWDRKNPNTELLQQLEQDKVALLYPSDDSELASENTSFDSYILLDATWQEAQKMYKQSPYLQNLPKLKITSSTKSIYSLRRNQKPDGLCTAECVVELLTEKGSPDKAESLQQKLIDFVTAMQKS